MTRGAKINRERFHRIFNIIVCSYFFCRCVQRVAESGPEIQTVSDRKQKHPDMKRKRSRIGVVLSVLTKDGLKLLILHQIILRIQVSVVENLLFLHNFHAVTAGRLINQVDYRIETILNEPFKLQEILKKRGHSNNLNVV